VKKLVCLSKTIGYFCTSLLFFYINPVMADDATLGSIATTITQSFSGLSKLITAGAFLAGIGFAMAAILKFKAHRDNAQQVPIGAPIALLFVAAALMFLPTVYGSIGVSVFGTEATKGSLTGVTI
jgi:intracellular multiplication protein IcmD